MQDRDLTIVVDKIAFFKKSAMWPLQYSIDADGWLRNFRDDELDVAIALLDAFVYLSPEATGRILSSGFHRLSSTVVNPMTVTREQVATWHKFRDEVIVTYPTDERPGATDSGRTYLRKARAILGLRQPQYMDPIDAIAARHAEPHRPIVFLDDFAGSGNQFCQTWHRSYNVGSQNAAFSECVAGGLIAYLPIVCSYKAVEAISSHAPEVILSPGHTLGREYSAFDDHSLIWPSAALREKSVLVLRNASQRAGIPLGNGADPDDWCGYRNLGLAIAIEDTIPDACLTVLYWESNGWRPLFRRP